MQKVTDTSDQKYLQQIEARIVQMYSPEQILAFTDTDILAAIKEAHLELRKLSVEMIMQETPRSKMAKKAIVKGAARRIYASI